MVSTSFLMALSLAIFCVSRAQSQEQYCKKNLKYFQKHEIFLKTNPWGLQNCIWMLKHCRRGYFHFIKNCGLLTSPTPCSLLFMWSSPLNARRKDNPDKNRRYKTPKILIIICSGSFRLWKSLLWKMWLRGIWLLRSVGFEESETWLVSQFWEFKIDKAGRSKELK